MSSASAQRVVVIGAGQAAGQFAVSLRSDGFDGTITLIGDESHIPYRRPPLSKALLAGEVGVERTHVKPADFYAEKNIQLRLGERATAIDRGAKTVALAGGDSLGYDALVLATGSRVRRLALPGTDAANVFYLRTLDDMLAIQPRLGSGARLVVIGGGYIGLEVAAVAVDKGVKVTVLERAERLMPRVVSGTVADFYHRIHTEAGVNFEFGVAVDGLSVSGSAADAVICADGRRFDADFIVVGVGIEPNVELAAEAGLGVDNGILVDADARSVDDPAVFAIGDCSNAPCQRYDRRARLESVPNALGQARAAAAAVCGGSKPHHEVPWFWSDQYKYKLQIVGFNEGFDQAVTRGDPSGGSFIVGYLRDGALLSAEAVANPREFMACRKLVAEKTPIDPEKFADTGVAMADVVAS